PYGPVVSDFPILPPLREGKEEHDEYLRSLLRTGRFPDGRRVDDQRRRFFEQMVAEPLEDFPETIPQILADASCTLFGNLCPVFFVAEPFAETKTVRSHSRIIPREVMLKVIRRDG